MILMPQLFSNSAGDVQAYLVLRLKYSSAGHVNPGPELLD